jgi:hypothetical protein
VPTQREHVLLQQIAREGREIRILESERGLLLSRFNHCRSQQGGGGTCATPANSSPRNNKKRPRSRRHDGGGPEDDVTRLPDDSKNTDGERDLLDVLDALQCRTTVETMNNKNNIGEEEPPPSRTFAVPDDIDAGSLKEVDVDSYRLHPILGGVAFTSVEGPLPPTQDRPQEDVNRDPKNNRKLRLYILSGHTIASLSAEDGSGFKSGGRIGFEVQTEISFADRFNGGLVGNPIVGDERAAVSSVHTKFFPLPPNAVHDDQNFAPPFPVEELRELSDLVSKTRSLTDFFRELAAFNEFHQERSASMGRLVKEFGTGGHLSILCANLVEIRSGSCNKQIGKARLSENEEAGACAGAGPLMSLRVSWSRSFSELGREDDLCVEDCTVRGRDGGEDDYDASALVKTILAPGGIHSLVHCAGGIEEAIGAILRAVAET